MSARPVARRPVPSARGPGPVARSAGPRGTVLLAVLIVTALASMVAVTAMYRMHSESAACVASARNEQAYAAARSGMQRAMVLLAAARESGENLHDNPALFKNQFVCDDGANRWYFTVYASAGTAGPGALPGLAEGDAAVRYGVTDEAGKVNLNVAPRECLLRLPNMTEELADCLIDFRDRDSEPSPNGAEQEYYSQLKYPYTVKNSPFFTLEEILLVKGFSGAILYGEDANLNGILDPNEDDGEASFPDDDGDGVLNPGLRGLATTLTFEPDLDSGGQKRTNLNMITRAVAGLDARTLEFIRMVRADGTLFVHPSQLLQMEYKLKADARTGSGGSRFGRDGRGEGGELRPGPRAGETIFSYVGASELPAVMDKLTTNMVPRMPLIGLLNVNGAPEAALEAVPGIDRELARRIVEMRQGLTPEERASTAWLFTQGLVDADTFKLIAPRLTARSFQYRVQCVGFGVPCGRYRVLEAVIDLSAGQPRTLYLRDLTRLGVPLALDVELQEGGK